MTKKEFMTIRLQAGRGGVDMDFDGSDTTIEILDTEPTQEEIQLDLLALIAAPAAPRFSIYR